MATVGSLKRILSIIYWLTLMNILHSVTVVLSFCPPVYRKFMILRTKFDQMYYSGLKQEEIIWSYATFQTYKRMTRTVIENYWYKEAEEGKKAPNPALIKLDQTRCYLLDFMKSGRPLVVNFGSCT